jgi:hypothetical protein
MISISLFFFSFCFIFKAPLIESIVLFSYMHMLYFNHIHPFHPLLLPYILPLVPLVCILHLPHLYLSLYNM